MRYSIIFVAVLILISGFIAYFGDLLGRWMGKKRLTIGSLRPRHTAYTVTAVTGMLISGMVVVTLVAVNSEFRQVLTDGEQILRQNKTLTQTNAHIERLNLGLQRRSARLQAEVAKREQEVADARADAAKAKAEYVRQLKLVASLKHEVEARTREVAARQKQLDALGKELDSARSEAALARADLALSRNELGQVQDSLNTAQSRLATAQSRLATADSRVAAADANLATAKAKLDETNRKLAETQATLAQQQITMQQQQHAIDEQQETIDFQRTRIGQLGVDKLRFQTERNVLRSGTLVVRQGDEIARGIISPRQSDFGIRSDLMSLLSEAGDRAAKAGAAIGKGERAVKFIVKRPISATQEVVDDDEAKNLRLATSMISQATVDVLAQVVCAENTVEGEQVPVEIILYPNKLVYAKGDLIASTTMDGYISEGRILLNIIKFLQEDVSRAGLAKGIVPIANPDSRVNMGPNPRTQLEGLMTVVDQVKSKNAKVSVDVYACADIYAAGPLNMDNMRFSVAKLP